MSSDSAQDGPDNVRGRERVNKLLATSLGGVALSLGLVIRLRRNPQSTLVALPRLDFDSPLIACPCLELAQASVYSLAFKALAIGTLSSVSSLGLATACLAKYLNVYSLREFGQYARNHLEGLAPQPSSSSP